MNINNDLFFPKVAIVDLIAYLVIVGGGRNPPERLTFKLLKMTEEIIGMIVGIGILGLLALYVSLSSTKKVKA